MKAKKQTCKVLRVRPDAHYRVLVAAVKARKPVHEMASDALLIGLRQLERHAPALAAQG